MILSSVRRLCTKASSYYAVRKGRNIGIYKTWDDCKQQVQGYNQPEFKKFQTKSEAEQFLGLSSNHASDQGSGEEEEEELIESVYHAATFPTSPVVYTDGCCLNNGQSGAVGGIGVYWAPHHPMNVSEPFKDGAIPTNQKAEIVAACRALECCVAMGLAFVEVRTDSMYVINAMTKWVHKWETTGWTGVQNAELMKRLLELCYVVHVSWVHVPAHRGVYGNEEADRLANEGAAKIDNDGGVNDLKNESVHHVNQPKQKLQQNSDQHNSDPQNSEECWDWKTIL